MIEPYYVGAYWSVRRETAATCAQRTEAFFRLLATCDPSLSQWFETGWTLEEALQNPFEADAASMTKVLRQQEKEEGRFADQGFSLRLWNGRTNEPESGLSLCCGYASVWIPNCCVIRLPREGPAKERVLQAPMLARILRAMTVAWEPEWGVATSHELRDLMSESAEPGTFVGWLTYFSHRRGPLPPLPPPVRVEPVEDKGSLVILTPERLTASNPSHVALAHEVSERLAQAGLLTPLKPCDT